MNEIRRIRVIAVALVAALLPAVVRGEFRHALVIGQSQYRSGGLAAPPKDLAAVAEALERRGFAVTRAADLATVKELDDAVKAFARTVTTGGTALVYYSGHAAPMPVPPGTKPPRQEPALVALDGSRHPLAAVLRPLVVPQYGPYGNGWQGKQSGSRINVLVVDAVVPAPPPVAAAGGEPQAGPTPPGDAAPHPDSLIVFRPADIPVPAADAPGLSPLAERFVEGLGSTRPLDAVLSGLSRRTASSLAEGELARLAGPASKAVSAPDALAPGGRPGDEWVDANGIVFCWCPPGESAIGSPSGEPGRESDERPARVSFAEGFWMAKHELCYRESIPLAGGIYLSTGEHKLLPVNKAGGLNLAKLFETADAQAPPGWEYGLPTEAEWEYAARAGTTTAYSFGDDPAALARHGNFADRTLRESATRSEVAKAAGDASPHKVYNGDRQTGLHSYAHPVWNDASATVARVGSHRPNAWGLCDMHGNVAETTSTVYDPLRLAPVVPTRMRAEWSRKPENEKFARGFVAKGGSWASVPGSCRSAFRGWSSVADNIVGTRLVLRRREAVREPPATRWTVLVPAAFSGASGATATIAPDGTVLVAGAATTGDAYTVTCPVPAGLEPRAVRLEILADPSLPKQGPGRRADGGFQVAEVAIAAVRGDGPPAAVEVLDVQSDLRVPPAGALVDGRPETTWGGPGDAKDHEVVFTVGLPSRTGGDGARWRPPAGSSRPPTSLVVTIAHPNAPNHGPATLGKFRLAVLHDDRAAVKESAK